MKPLKPPSPCFKRKAASGSVMIVTLWTIALLTILIAALASQTRLSAKVAYFQQQDLADWANISAALNQAEMEVLLERMPAAVQKNDNPEDLNAKPLNRFNGEELDLYYPQAEGIKVRIYDHAGKINIREISRARLRLMLLHMLGDDAEEQVDQMMTAWGDWHDLSDQAGLNGGAERDYYLSLDPPYVPRNGPLESVEEILLIKGFYEVFKDVDLDAAFTLYGENELVNLNLATVEAMRLLPGLNDELILEILAWRRNNTFQGNLDITSIVPAENMAELRSWLSSTKNTNYYTILAYKDVEPDNAEGVFGTTISSDDEIGSLYDPKLTAYAETISLQGANKRPRVLKVTPYQKLPLHFKGVAVE